VLRCVEWRVYIVVINIWVWEASRTCLRASFSWKDRTELSWVELGSSTPASSRVLAINRLRSTRMNTVRLWQRSRQIWPQHRSDKLIKRPFKRYANSPAADTSRPLLRGPASSRPHYAFYLVCPYVRTTILCLFLTRTKRSKKPKNKGWPCHMLLSDQFVGQGQRSRS